jgi:alpha-glucosidase (family GH31 glycosyl hydrolase)
MMHKVVTVLWLMGILGFLSECRAMNDVVTEEGNSIVIRQDDLVIKIQKPGFRYSFHRADGVPIVGAHAVSGIQLGQAEHLEPITKTVYLQSEGQRHCFEVSTQSDLSAKVIITLSEKTARFSIETNTDEPIAIVARTGPAQPGYGLGDNVANWACPKGFHSPVIEGHGTEITGFSNDLVYSEVPLVRAVCNFVIYPKNGFGLVNMDPFVKIVRSTHEEVAQGSRKTLKMDKLFYFFGTPKQIYREFLKARRENGYDVMLPKYEFFGVGWEAFGALAWRTNQQTVTENVDRYLDAGFPIKWMVVGSGFWKGGGMNGPLAATTSFGMWDEQLYPDPKALIEHFHNRGLKFFIGLRISFTEHGPFTQEGLEKGYFITENGRPKLFKISFPRDPVYLLETQNPEAVRWYADLCDLWGVDGFKEDLFGFNKYFLRDDLLNPVNIELMKRGYYVMGRNGYLGSQSDLHRIEDFNYDQDQDRGPINSLATAYAGLPFLYPDIVGGCFGDTEFENEVSQRIKIYLMRNAQWASLHPSMSLGKGPWNYNDPKVESVILEAAKLHDRLHPYFYSQAVRFCNDGFPWPMAPLPIVFHEDSNVDGRGNSTVRGYQWMIGDALLAVPLYGNDYDIATCRDVYLPEGSWVDYDSGKRYSGPTMLKDFELPVGKTPLFVGGTGIVIEQKNGALYGRVYPVIDKAKTVFFHRDANTKSTICINVNDWDNIRCVDTTKSSTISLTFERHAWQFPFEPGHDCKIE